MQKTEAGPLLSLPKEIEHWRSKWQIVHRELPLSLFHYTDAKGLRGIITSGELWATHVYYLNDAQEFRFARGVIEDVFGEWIDRHSGSVAARIERLKYAYQAYATVSLSLADPYVVCFCAEGNLLSQWRAYAANGDGFAIHFDPKSLMSGLKRDPDVAANAKLFRVIYDREEQRRFVGLAIQQLLSAMDTHDPQEVLAALPGVFSEMPFCFKHNAFSEEQEWRLVFLPRSERFLDVRVSAGHFVPYASFRICDAEERPPYVGITHGPTLEASNTEKALKMLLGKTVPKFWDSIRVSGSDAPLRHR
jgi:hypothetical protein